MTTAVLEAEPKMAEEKWENVLRAIDQQREGYAAFLMLLDEKEKYLLDGDTKGLADVVKREERSADIFEELEKRRQEAVAAATGRSGVSIRELLETSPETVRDRLVEKAVALMEMLNMLALKNRGNAELIKESMNFVSYQINLLSSTGQRRDNIYEGSGRMRSGFEQPPSSILNKRV